MNNLSNIFVSQMKHRTQSELEELHDKVFEFMQEPHHWKM